MNDSDSKINLAYSLQTYLEVVREVISYNFACRLEEYYVNSKARYAIHNQENLILLQHFA